MPPENATPNPLPKITASTAAEVCGKFELHAPAKPLLKPQQTPAQYLSLLEQNRLSRDAVNLLAYGLPEREAVVWACLCGRRVLLKLNTADKAALSAAEAWVKTSDAQAASKASEAASKTDMKGPGGWAAQAAGSSGGALAKAVAGSVLLAAGAMGRPTMPDLPKVDLQMPKIGMPDLNAPGPPKVQMPDIDQAALAAMLLAYPKLSEQASPAIRIALFASLALITVPSPALSAALAKVGLPALGGWAGQGVPWLQAMFPSVAMPTFPNLPSMPQMPNQPALPNIGSVSLPGLAMPGAPGISQVPKLGLNLPALDLPGFAVALQALSLQLPATALPALQAALGKISIPPIDLGKLAVLLQPFIEIGKEVAAGKIPC